MNDEKSNAWPDAAPPSLHCASAKRQNRQRVARVPEKLLAAGLTVPGWAPMARFRNKTVLSRSRK